MDTVFDGAQKLNELIKMSQQYRSYVAAKNELAAYPQYKEMVDSFRKKQVAYEAEKLSNSSVDESLEFALSNEYADICLIEVCNTFFLCEMDVLELIKGVFSRVCESLEIDMDFMG